MGVFIMKSFFVITNRDKDPNLEYTNQLLEYLKENGKTYTLYAKEEEGLYNIDIPSDVDGIITLGGDGTFIRTAGAFYKRQLPILGINIGTLGYLTELDLREHQGEIQEFLQGKYAIEDRMMLRGDFYKKEGEVIEYIALNDIVIHRGICNHLLEFEIYVNGKRLNKYKADGIVIATPTGSTAYNLSAGGPIVDPSAAMIVITPVAPHTLNTRSIVLAGYSRIEIRLSSKNQLRGGEGIIQIDGNTGVPFKCGDRLSIRQGDISTRLVKLSQESFLDTLRRKMRES